MTRFPKGIFKKEVRISCYRDVPVAVFCIQFNIQISSNNLVFTAGHRIGKPRKSGPDKHRHTQHHGKYAEQQCALCVLRVCHFNTPIQICRLFSDSDTPQKTAKIGAHLSIHFSSFPFGFRQSDYRQGVKPPLLENFANCLFCIIFLLSYAHIRQPKGIRLGFIPFGCRASAAI
ncbi:hypothetical protein IMSAG013_00482 [Clostridiales bacterium]|nr:hypothetical protein IMSAG013_00482 [Clostridiales bacterium]